MQATKGQWQLGQTSILGFVSCVPCRNFGYGRGRGMTSLPAGFVGANPDEADSLGTLPVETSVADWTAERLDYLRHSLDYYIARDSAVSLAHTSPLLAQLAERILVAPLLNEALQSWRFSRYLEAVLVREESFQER